MAANEIKISIGGDAQGFQKAATQTSTSLTNIGKSATSATVALNKTTPGFNQASQSLTNLSRIAQDAPFGFIGIQNNLNPLIESFGRLKQETGSSAAAFKSLLAGLAGPAGVGLALGVVTGLVTVAVQKYGSLGNAINALFGDYDALAQANNDLSKSFAEATGKAAGEQAAITSLVGIARNEALSREARNEAINKLNKEYDEFLPKLTLENINTQAVTDSVNKLNEALLRQAKIKGVQDLISKEFERLTKVMTDLGESSGFLDILKASFTGLGGPIKTGTDLVENALDSQAKAADEAKKRIALFNGVLNELLTTEAKEGTLFTETQKKGTDALKERIEQLKKLQAVAGLTTSQLVELAQLEIQLVQRDQAKLGFSKSDVQSAVDEIIRRTFPDDFKMTVAANIDVVPTTEKPDVSKALGLDKINEADFDAAMQRIRDQAAASARRTLDGLNLGEAFAQRLTEGFVEGLAGIGDALGQALNGGGIGNAFATAAQGMLNILGGALQEIGKQIIITSQLVIALKKALSTLFANPVAALGVGLGLVALGGLLKNIKFNLPAFADGGITSGPSSGFPAILHPNEAIIPLNKLPDIVGRLRSNEPDMALAPVVTFGYDKLFIGLQRVQGRRERLG